MTLQGREVRPVRLLPLEHYEDYGDIPPEGMDLEDVELIWWTVASRMSKKELRKRLSEVADGYRDTGCFRYAAVSDVLGAVVTLGGLSTFLNRF
jgi:hypothetical protein